MHKPNTHLYETIKLNAQLLHKIQKQSNLDYKLSHAQEELSRLYNFHNFNHLIGILKQGQFIWPKTSINIYENPFGVREIVDISNKIFFACSKTVIFAVNNYEDEDELSYAGTFVDTPKEMLDICLKGDIKSIIIADLYHFIRTKVGKSIFNILLYSNIPITVVVTKLSVIKDLTDFDFSSIVERKIQLADEVVRHIFISNKVEKKIAAFVYHSAKDKETGKYIMCYIEEDISGYEKTDVLLSTDYTESKNLVDEFNQNTFNLDFHDVFKIFASGL